MTIRIALVGLGAIAKAQHLPVIAASADFKLVAIVSPETPVGVACAHFRTMTEMLEAMGGAVDAVAICTPPLPRFAIAAQAIGAGIPVLLEKPPAATLGEFDELVRLAAEKGVAIHTAWHSQCAAGVARAAELLAGERIARLSMLWREDVHKYHAGQEWIWEAGGFGVFDPGINGFSILTRILEEPLLVSNVSLQVPANCQTPIAADVVFHGKDHTAAMDWRCDSDEQWSIEIDLESGKSLKLHDGGARLDIDGVSQPLSSDTEYFGIYEEFKTVVKSGQSRIDREPLRIVADCLLIGERRSIEAIV